MGINPNQGKESDQSMPYGGYGGYTPPTQPNDPYTSQPYGGQQGGYQQPDASSQQGGYQQYSSGQQQQQQYNTYQPPLTGRTRSRSGGNTASSSTGATSTGMAPNRAALWSYAFWWISGLVFLFIEKKNRFVRFHAAQSFAFLGSSFVVLVALHFIGGLLGGIPLIGFIFGWIFGLASFVIIVPTVIIWLFLMLQSYRGVTVKLPFFGNYAERLATRLGGKDAV